MTFPTWVQGQANPEVPVNEALGVLSYAAVYGRDPDTTTGLTWGYLGGRWGGFSVAAGTLTLTDASANYVVASRTTGAVTVATTDTNWNSNSAYARIFKLTTAGGLVTAIEDHRAGDSGIFGSSSGASAVTQAIPIACSDETTALTTGLAKVTFRMPFAMTLTEVRASLTTAATGAALIVDINEGGASILSTKLSIDAGETTSKTAAAPAVISDSALADDAEITIDIDQIGSTIAGAGLKVYLIGVKA